MATYKLEFTRELWCDVIIEASNQDEALAKFWNGEYDTENVHGTEIQEGVDIEEVEDDPAEFGSCDACGEQYELASRFGRCGDCGNCSHHCEHNPCETCGNATNRAGEPYCYNCDPSFGEQ
jgi:hypothetical protein